MLSRQDLDGFAKSIEDDYARLCKDPNASEEFKRKLLELAVDLRRQPDLTWLPEAVRKHSEEVKLYTDDIAAACQASPEFRSEWRAQWFTDELAGVHEPYEKVIKIEQDEVGR